MTDSLEKTEHEHRTSERYYCPPFFLAHISGGGNVEERAAVEDLSLRGMKARTSCDFEKGCNVRIKLASSYSGPVHVHGRVTWSVPPVEEGSSYLIGLSITKVRILDWLKFIKTIAQIKKEVW